MTQCNVIDLSHSHSLALNYWKEALGETCDCCDFEHASLGIEFHGCSGVGFHEQLKGFE